MSTRDEREFAERIGRLFEEAGASRISGRIVGWLLICDPPEQTQPDLVDALSVSKASISTELRALIQRGLIARTTKPGERRSYYRIDNEAWPRLLAQRLDTIVRFREAAGVGLALLEGAPEERRTRLELVGRAYGHMETAMKAALNEIEAELEARRKERA